MSAWQDGPAVHLRPEDFEPAIRAAEAGQDQIPVKLASGRQIARTMGTVFLIAGFFALAILS